MKRNYIYFDKWLLFGFLSLLIIGFIMMTSASVSITEKFKLPIFYFACNQFIYIILGLSCFYAISFVPIRYIQYYSVTFLVFSFVLLSIILIPGVTRPINGSIRWLFVWPISIQPSEIAKLALIIYMAGYMVRRNDQLHTRIIGFFIPLFVLGLVAFLLILEPDFGAVVVITLTVLCMLFLGGVQFKRFLILLPLVVCALGALAVSSSYRVQRFVAFTDPWRDQYNTGYQLVQSLIAFGRGAWFGTGLGGSVQKLLYLPEAHTDFIFAVIAEELGLVGALVVLCLYALFIFRGMEVGKRALQKGHLFASYLVYGIVLWLGLQAIINIGVSVGIFPTKGLTLPFMSCGGSSMIIMCLAVGIIFRVDFEVRC